MLGAIVGDVVGSRYEFHNHKSTDFELFHERCRLTDDSVMTLAIARALTESEGDVSTLSEQAVRAMRDMGARYPDAGYGGRFRAWLVDPHPQPYHSYGNGSGMRVSPVAYVGNTIDEVISLSDAVTKVTHDHAEGIKGARAIAVAVFLARTGATKAEIAAHIREHYYDIDFTLDDIRDNYVFYVDCMRSVPVAIEAFLESEDFESALRLAVSVGGDSDTIADMTAAIAGAYYGVPDDIAAQCATYMDEYQFGILSAFERKYCGQ